MKKTPQIIKKDAYLEPYTEAIINRLNKAAELEKKLTSSTSLSAFANGHHYFGLHKTKKGWILREWAPAARQIYVVGDFSEWKPVNEYKMNNIGNGIWEITIQEKKLKHKDLYKLFIIWEGGCGERIPAWATRVVQNTDLMVFNAQVWHPAKPYQWKNQAPNTLDAPIIYEAHIGMCTAEPKVASYNEFTSSVLPHIAQSGYNTVQLMAIKEHPYYGSFGYHVSNFFACSSRFGTPDELKKLIDSAHGYGLRVIMDIVHSHAVKNEAEGLSRFDGTLYQYFHDGSRGEHIAWDSRCFNYSKDEVLHFLLSNCKFWLEEYKFDGFRFDGVTSMIYLDHGLGSNFTSYEQYYNLNQDEDALCYLLLANKLIHEINPQAITIAEEMSGMPGIATPLKEGGYGFDYRLAMGVPDFWIKIIKEVKDEFWHVGDIYYNLTNKRQDEKIVSYAESHDQALVGDQTIIFRLIGAEMYNHMHIAHQNISVERGMALHKMIRLITFATAGNAYLNFMGNEFGHPEWIDFPREGNNWSFHYARRQWHLLHDKNLRYQQLYLFEKHFISLCKIYNTFNSYPNLLIQDVDKQVLVFARTGLIFVFNFSPFNSYTDYQLELNKGEYEFALNSDSKKYGGHNRINENMTYTTLKSNNKFIIKLYLPTHTALILRKI